MRFILLPYRISPLTIALGLGLLFCCNVQALELFSFFKKKTPPPSLTQRNSTIQGKKPATVEPSDSISSKEIEEEYKKLPQNPPSPDKNLVIAALELHLTCDVAQIVYQYVGPDWAPLFVHTKQGEELHTICSYGRNSAIIYFDTFCSRKNRRLHEPRSGFYNNETHEKVFDGLGALYAVSTDRTHLAIVKHDVYADKHIISVKNLSSGHVRNQFTLKPKNSSLSAIVTLAYDENNNLKYLSKHNDTVSLATYNFTDNSFVQKKLNLKKFLTSAFIYYSFSILGNSHLMASHNRGFYLYDHEKAYVVQEGTFATNLNTNSAIGGVFVGGLKPEFVEEYHKKNTGPLKPVKHYTVPKEAEICSVPYATYTLFKFDPQWPHDTSTPAPVFFTLPELPEGTIGSLKMNPQAETFSAIAGTDRRTAYTFDGYEQ